MRAREDVRRSTRLGGRFSLSLVGLVLAGLFAAQAAYASGPVITDYAGTGTAGTPTPGPALSSMLSGPVGVVADANGNLYIADTNNNQVEKVTPSGTLSIIAGTGTGGAPTPGPATSSDLSRPEGVAVDSSGNVYIADTNNNQVEKVTPGGTLSIIAGTGTAGAPTPGPATSSDLSGPKGLAVDSSGNLYIADTANNQIEKVTPGGTLSIIAGTGTGGAPIPGPATSSNLSGPEGVGVDSSGNIYIADTNNNQVERVTPGGTLSILAGTGIGGPPTAGPATSSNLRGPEGVGVDSSGNIYIADTNNKQVEKVTPGGTLSILAGTGAYSGPIPGPALSSPLDYPEGVVVDPSGNVYITIDVDADGNNYVVKVTPGGMLSIFAGNGTNGVTTNGPATSTALNGPQGLAVDAGGNVYIADNLQIEQVTPSGTLTVLAGDGTFGAPTYGAAATSSALNDPTGVAVVPGGTVYIADSANNTIDRVGLTTPGAPGQPQLTPGDTTAQLSFTPPVDPGTSLVTGYQVSLDGGATWQTISTTPGAGGALTTTLSGLTDGTTYSVMVRAVNGSGPGQNSPSGSVTPEPPAPVSTGIPVVSGAASVGHTLACSPGSWTNNPTRFSYQWYRDGALIPGATAQNYLVARADQGHTITCTVTASNGSTSAQVSSAGIRIPIANASLCPKPSGRLAGTRLGPVWLGLTRSHARRKLPRFAERNSYSDNFCLAPGWGIRVGYASSQLLPNRTRLRGGEIILALTANSYYALHGVKPGMRAAPVVRRLKLGQPIELGPNSWYTIPSPLSTGVLKVRHGVIYEIGIVDKGLTSTRAAQARLLVNF